MICLPFFQFPKIREGMYESTFEQLFKVREEAREAITAFEQEGEDRVLEELWDVKWAVETELRHHPFRKRVRSFFLCVAKNVRRGYVTPGRK